MSSTFMTARRHHEPQSSNMSEYLAPVHSFESQLPQVGNELPRIPSHSLNVQAPDAHSPAFWSTSSNYLGGDYAQSSSSSAHTDSPSIHSKSVVSSAPSQNSSSELNRDHDDREVPSGTSNPPSLSKRSSSSHSQSSPAPVHSAQASADSSMNSNSYNYSSEAPPPANVGKTEIDRLMLAVQAQSAESRSHTASKSPEREHSKVNSTNSNAIDTDHTDSIYSGTGDKGPVASEGESDIANNSVRQSDDGKSGASDPSNSTTYTSHSRSSSRSEADAGFRASVGSNAGHPSSPVSAVRSRSGTVGVSKHSDYNFYCTFPGCMKRFKQRAHMHTHLRSHTGERPFECPYENCRKTFSQRCNLHTHIRSHTGERPYRCEVCGKTFSQQGNMRHHILIHYNENPLVCKIDGCMKTFNQLGNLKAHQNTAHRNALQNMTQKLQSGVKVEDLPEEEKEMFEYFCSLYKNSNRGIKGRGKGTKTIAIKTQESDNTRNQGSVDTTMDSFVPELLRQRTPHLSHDITAKDQFGQGLTPEQIQQYQADTQQFYPENQRLQSMHHNHQLPHHHQQQQHQQEHQPQLIQHQPGLLNQSTHQPLVQHQSQNTASHQQSQPPVLFSQVDMNHAYVQQQQPTPYASYNSNQQFSQLPNSQVVPRFPGQYEHPGEIGIVSQPQQTQQLSYPVGMQQVQQPVQYPLYYSQAMPVSDNQETLPSIMYLPKEEQQQ